MHNLTIPADEFTTSNQQSGELKSSAITVKPKISVNGTTFTIKVFVSVDLVAGTLSDTKTFVLSKANKWSDKQTFFVGKVLGAADTDVVISVDRPHKRVHIHIAPPLIDAIDKYIPFSAIDLPSEFDKWSPHKGPELDQLKKSIAKANKIGKPAPVSITQDATGVKERCDFLGHPGYTDKAVAALGLNAKLELEPRDGGNVLFAVGVLLDANAYVGVSANGGFWWTDTGQCGFYSGGGAEMGATVSINDELVYTVVVARDGKSALENFQNYHIARGVVGEGLEISVALLGDITGLEIFGVIYGFGVGFGTPAGGYVGASRQVIGEL